MIQKRPNMYVGIELNSEENIPTENQNITEGPQYKKPENVDKKNIQGIQSQLETQVIEVDDNLTENHSEELKKRIELYKITKFNYFWIFLGAILYIIDVGSDLILGIRYFISHEWLYAFFTLCFVIGSSILYNFFNKTALWWKAERNSCFYLWICPYFLLNAQFLLQLYSNYRIIKKYFEYTKTNNIEGQISQHKKFIHGYKKAAALKHDETLWEALPQVIIQLYILLSTYDQLELNNKLIIQLVALSTSSLGILSTRFTYHRAFHFPRGDRVSVAGGVIMSIGYSIPLVCRAICLACAIATPPWYLPLVMLLLHLLILLFHWPWCMQWWVRSGRSSLDMNILAVGLGLTLQPSLHDSRHCLVSNVIIGIENYFLVFIWTAVGERFFTRWPVAIAVTIIDLVCRTVMVLYWYHRDRFKTKVIKEATPGDD